MSILLDDALTPQQAWIRLCGAIVVDSLTQDCAPLIDWLRVAITARAANQNSILSVKVPLVQPLANLTEVREFQVFCAGIIDRDHPKLSTNLVNHGVNIATSIGALADQTRLQREADEQRRAKERNKTPLDLFAVGLQKFMRWCQVHSKQSLPSVYGCAANARKATRQNLLQDAVNEAMEDLGYAHDFPITLKVTNKVFDLEWSSRLVDDLSKGLHIFTLCWVVEKEADSIKGRNFKSDQIQGSDTAVSVADITTILDITDEVHIMKTLSELRYSVEQAHAFWTVLLGSYHPKVGEYHAYHRHLIDHYTKLHCALPRNCAVGHLVPVLLDRRIQIADTIWLRSQAKSQGYVPVLDMLDVFQDIDRKKDWAPDLPLSYFQSPAVLEYDDVTSKTRSSSCNSRSQPQQGSWSTNKW